MALFKISKGNSANLPADMHDGYCYFTIDDGKFYIDYIDINDNDTLKRRAITGVSVEYIEGTQTVSTNAWTGVTKDANLYKGKIIAYKLPYKGTNSAATLTLTLSNGSSSGAIAVKRQGASQTTTHYPAGTVIFMAYDGLYWQVNADYDSDANNAVTQSVTVSDEWRKVLLHFSTNSEGGDVPAEVTNKVWAAKGIEVQPSTGTLAATKFKGPLEGNADTATEFSSNANVTLTGDVSGSANSKKGWDITTTLATTGVTAGNYGPSANATPDYGGTFNVPYLTVDAKGRIITASTKTVKIPAKVTLSGGSAAGNDATVVGGVTVSNQTVTVAKKTLTPGAGFVISGATDKITLKPKLKSETAVDLDSSPMGNTANRQYPVGIDKSGYLSVNIPWTNTWRGIQDNLTSDSATDSLSAKQGKVLNEKIDGLLMAQDAMVFKGTLGETTGSVTALPTSGYSAGWTYRVADAGTYAGEYCEKGDLIIAIADGPASGNSVINADWAKIEHNIDGAVYMRHGGAAIGGEKTPVYVTATGLVTAGTPLKALAYKDSLSYTPAGTISNTSITPAGTISSTTITPAGTNAKSAVTIKATTTDVYSMTSAGSVTAGSAASLTMTVDDETLSFSWTANTPTAVTLPGRSSVIKAWTGYTTGVDNTYAAAQVFTGTAASHSHTFTGTAASHKHTFTGTAATLS